MNILVGLSGGVDSATCLHILKEQNHKLVGAMMTIYDGDCIESSKISCYKSDKTNEINDARKICEDFGIDFHLINLASEFNEIVFDKFKDEYKSANTPNPCLECNSYIKFGALLNKAKDQGIVFDKFATGHYAQVEFCDTTSRFILKRGVDTKKDQSYFLYKLNQEQLSRIIFPLGGYTKEQTREYALKNNLICAKKQESQDFYAGKYTDLLDFDDKKGKIIDTFGNVLGEHNGTHNFTIGQRKGIQVAYSEPLYVVSLDAESNKVIVGTKENSFSTGLLANNVNSIYKEKFDSEFVAHAKLRSAGSLVECSVKVQDDVLDVKFKEPQSAIAPGQSIVFYDDDIVLGGAVIKSFY